MKDYSNFIQTPYGFIKKYEIIDNQLMVYTTESKRGEPHIYTATKENISYIDERLGNQYNMILKNRKIIKKDFMKKKCQPINLAGLFTFGATVLAGSCVAIELATVMPLILTGLVGSIVLVSAYAITTSMEHKFDTTMDIYQDYLNQRENIAKKKIEDANVTRYLSDNATCKIKEKEQLRDSGLIDMPFNIDLMDKVKLKDLKKLLVSYYICEDLRQKQNFVVPKEYKTKTKKKEVKSNIDTNNKR